MLNSSALPSGTSAGWAGELTERLEATRPGLAVRDLPLAPKTRIKIGGPADVFVRPKTVEELELVLALAKEYEAPVLPLGHGANALVADNGVRAVVIRLTDALRDIRAVNRTTMRLGGGANNKKCSRVAQRFQLSGLEFLDGIPGTPGGGVRTNAGAYGGKFEAVTSRAFLVTHAGSGWLSTSEIGFAHRSSCLPRDAVVAFVEVELEPTDPRLIEQKMKENAAARDRDQPHTVRTFGSTFLNPSDLGEAPYAAGALIDQCTPALKGTSIGGAEISTKHANWIENNNAASARDVIDLMRLARRSVLEQFEILLEPEVVLMGAITLSDGASL